MLTAASRAGAHGGFVRAFEILSNPAKPEQFVARSDVWGFFHSNDGGKTWQWSCSVVYGARSTETARVNMALTSTGRLIVANSFRGLYYTDDFCSWSRPTGMEPQADAAQPMVTDVKVLADGTVMALTSSNDGVNLENRLWKSQNGAAFSLVKELEAPDLGLYSLAQAPSEPDRLYVMGAVIGENKRVILRSSDGGATFERMEAPIIDEPRLTTRIHAVHPTNPDLIFAWLDIPEEEGKDSPDEIWSSSNGGTTWMPVLKGRGDLPGLAFSPDGKTVVIGGTVDGLLRGSVADVIEKGGSALTQVNALPTWGLFWNQDGLHAGKDNFTARGTPETFTMGLSQDEGASFSPVVGICEFQFSHCPAGTQGHDLCAPDWEDPLGGFKKDFWGKTCDGPTDAGTGTRDAGASASLEERGCSCSTPGTNPPSGALGALALGAIGAGFLRRRR